VEWYKFLDSLKKELQEEWSKSIYVGETGDETLQRNAAAIGQVQLIDKLKEATVENVTEENYEYRE